MHTLEIYLKSGHTIDVVCEDYNFKWDGLTCEYVGYSFKGVKNVERVDLVPSQVAGFIVKNKQVKE